MAPPNPKPYRFQRALLSAILRGGASAVTCGDAGEGAFYIDGASEPYNRGAAARQQSHCQRVANPLWF